MCVVAANVVFTCLRCSPKSLSWISGAVLRQGKERGKGKEGGKERMGEFTPKISVFVTALQHNYAGLACT